MAHTRRRGMPRPTGRSLVLALALVLVGVATAAVAGAATARQGQEDIKVALITKDATNPFFVKMRAGATAEAKRLGAELRYAAGKSSSDNAGQITAIENMVTAGVKGILITVADGKAQVPAILKARKAGVLVIALDTPTVPTNATDALFATNNLNAGVLIGKYARAATKGKKVTIAMLDEHAGSSVGAPGQRNGFLEGLRDQEQRQADRLRGQRTGPDGALADRHGELPPEEPRHRRRLHDQRAQRGRRVERVEAGRQDPGRRHDRVGRRRLRRRAERPGRRDRRDVAAVPAEDGLARRGRGRPVREDGREGERATTPA